MELAAPNPQRTATDIEQRMVLAQTEGGQKIERHRCDQIIILQWADDTRDNADRRA